MQVQPTARGARNYSQCDSMLIGDTAAANTYPYIQVCDPGSHQVLSAICVVLPHTVLVFVLLMHRS